MFSQPRSLIAIILFLTLFSTGFSQTTWYVPDDFSSIQPAIDSSLVIDDDTVIVRSGTYLERLDFNGKAITLISEMGPAVTVIKGNSYGPTVTMLTDEGLDSVLEGFTITHVSGIEGSGIKLGSASPTIRNCRIINNEQYYNPGGMECFSSSPLITDCLIEGNSSDWTEGDSGGMYFSGGAPIITNCEYKSNTAERYGALRLVGCNATLTSCTFTNNSTYLLGGAVGISGGTSLSFIDCIFDNNKTGDYPGFTAAGGAIHNDFDASNLTLLNCIFIGNSADQGGAIYGLKSGAEVSNCFFANNTAEEGGAIYLGGSPQFAHCTFYGNEATIHGAGMFISSLGVGDPEVVNSILWGNSPDQIYLDTGAGASLTYCDMEGGFPGDGNIDQDPLLADPVNDDLHLTWMSPCINRGKDTGTPDHDLDHDARPFMGQVDMGADEFIGPHPFQADAFSVPVTGGIVNLTLNAGAVQAGRTYLILGSKSGSVPGIPLPGGLVTLPVNWDAFTDFVIVNVNGSIFSNFLGVLDGSGQSTAQLNIPTIGTGNIGSLLQFAYILEGSPDWDFASNPLGVAITP